MLNSGPQVKRVNRRCGSLLKRPRRSHESQEDMRKRGMLSPDEWDAAVLTFAEPVGPNNFNRRLQYPSYGVA
jgi:hypothetical protein